VDSAALRTAIEVELEHNLLPFWRVRADGTVDEGEPKVSEWKGPYHSVRMCLEMMRRLDGGESGVQR